MNDFAKKLRVSLLALYALRAVGFMLIGDRSVFESLYMTTVILTTVGMREDGTIVAFFIDGQMRAILGRGTMGNPHE